MKPRQFHKKQIKKTMKLHFQQIHVESWNWEEKTKVMTEITPQKANWKKLISSISKQSNIERWNWKKNIFY